MTLAREGLERDAAAWHVVGRRAVEHVDGGEIELIPDAVEEAGVSKARAYALIDGWVGALSPAVGLQRLQQSVLAVTDSSSPACQGAADGDA